MGRLATWKRVLWSPLSKVLSIGLLLLTIAQLAYWFAEKKQWINTAGPADPAARILDPILRWPATTWAIVVLSLLVVVLLEGSYRVISRIEVLRPVLTAELVRLERQYRPFPKICVRITNSGASSDVSATIFLRGAALPRHWIPIAHQAKWVENEADTFRIPRGASGLIQIAQLRRGYQPHQEKYYWYIIRSKPEEDKANEIALGIVSSFTKDEPATAFFVDLAVYSIPDMTTGPPTFILRFCGEDVTILGTKDKLAQ